MLHRSICLAVLAVLIITTSSILASNNHYLPQAAAGVAGDYTFLTQISISNPELVASGIQINFYTNEGDAWSVKTSCLEDITLNQTTSRLTFTLQPKDKYAILVGLSGDIQVGWIAVTSEKNARVSATYGFYKKQPAIGRLPSDPLWEAAVLAAPSAADISFPAHQKLEDMIYGVSARTGYAIANPNGVEATVKGTVYDETGAYVAMETFTVPAHGHIAEFIDERFSGDYSDFRGVVYFSSPVPIAAIAMRESGRAGLAVYSTLPAQPESQFKMSMVYDCEPNSSPAQAQTIRTPVQIYGALNENAGANADYYAMDLPAGTAIQVIVLADILESTAHPVLRVTDAAGVVLAQDQEIFGTGHHDRMLKFTATTAGKYLLMIDAKADSVTYDRCFYRAFVRTY